MERATTWPVSAKNLQEVPVVDQCPTDFTNWLRRIYCTTPGRLFPHRLAGLSPRSVSDLSRRHWRSMWPSRHATSRRCRATYVAVAPQVSHRLVLEPIDEHWTRLTHGEKFYGLLIALVRSTLSSTLKTSYEAMNVVPKACEEPVPALSLRAITVERFLKLGYYRTSLERLRFPQGHERNARPRSLAFWDLTTRSQGSET
jgi:hypothetical protein